MKKLTILAASLFVFAAVNAQATTETKSTTAPAPQQQQQDITKVLSFKNDNYDFGKIPQGKPVEFDVIIRKMGADSIKIENVQVSCGCTTPKWQAGPYGENQEFKVTLGFNAAAMGPFNKTVTIFFSGGLTKAITFHGETYAAPNNAAPENKGLGTLKPGN